MASEKPVCPARDEFFEADVNRKRQLEALVADENAQALTSSEVGELLELRGRAARYFAYRGQVDAYFADQAKDAARPPNPADPSNAVAEKMREIRFGRRSDMATRAANTFQGTSLAHGFGDPLPEPAGRRAGTGTDRIARAVADNADRLEENRLKPGGFVW